MSGQQSIYILRYLMTALNEALPIDADLIYFSFVPFRAATSYIFTDRSAPHPTAASVPVPA